MLAITLALFFPRSSKEQSRYSAVAVPAVDVRSSLNVRTDIERAMWVWTPEDIIYNVGTAKEDLFRFCDNHVGMRDAAAPEFARHPINRLFFYAHGFVVSGQEEKDSLRSFLREAHARHIAVDFLDGEPSWIAADSNEADRVMDSVLRFNALGDPEERFDGVQFDVEPYKITGWYSDAIWSEYLDFLQKMRTKIDSSGETIRLGITMPRWYDIMLGADAVKQVYKYVQCVAVLDYVSDEPTLIEDVSNEVAIADTMGVKVYIGVQTGQSVPSTSSFMDEGWLKMERELAAVNNTYMFDKSYSGVAIDKYLTYGGMRRTGRSLEYASHWTMVPNLGVSGLSKCAADVVVVHDIPGCMRDIGDLTQMIKIVQNRPSSDLPRLVLAAMPLIDTTETRAPALSDTLESGFVKGGGVSDYSVTYYMPWWTGGLPQETNARLEACMGAGFDGVVIDVNAAVSAATLYAVPHPENSVVDLLEQAAQVVRGESGHKNAVIVVRCDGKFIHMLDDSHYRKFMSLIDGVVPCKKNLDATAYGEYGVKILSDDNFSPTSEEYQTASSDVDATSTVTAYGSQ